MATRERVTAALRALGFVLHDSKTNFVFAKHPKRDGEALYLALKERGILVRHFGAPRLKDYNRITIGSDAEMDTLIATLKELLV
jgi:histidinol-phosphate aminotransferase